MSNYANVCFVSSIFHDVVIASAFSAFAHRGMHTADCHAELTAMDARQKVGVDAR